MQPDAPAAPAGDFDLARFAALGRDRLAQEPPAAGGPLSNPTGDHAIDGDDAPAISESAARPAAVLIPVVRRPDATVLLTQRTSALRSHAGQVAFPGGKIDEGDGTPLNAALREAEEEVGLARNLVQPLGYLDPYLTGTGFRIIPVVALVEPDMKLVINPDEVESAFEVPLAFLMNPANHELHSAEWQGRMRRYYAMPWGERFIWGATAGIIHNLYRKFYT